MKTIKHQYSGKSILELRDKYGLRAKGFWNQSWYNDEDFAKDKAPAGLYEIDLGEHTRGQSFAEQKKGLPEGFTLVHPAILAEAILEHFAKTGERLLEHYWVRTSLNDSAGSVSCMGVFGGNGLSVFEWSGRPYGNVGVGASRNLSLSAGSLESSDSLTLDLAIKICKDNGLKVYKEC